MSIKNSWILSLSHKHPSQLKHKIYNYAPFSGAAAVANKLEWGENKLQSKIIIMEIMLIINEIMDKNMTCIKWVWQSERV